MSYVKLDCGILDSTLWYARPDRDVFITALLMASPFELLQPTAQIAVRTLDETGWMVPPGWYGYIPAAGIGIVRRSGVDTDMGLEALERLGAAENESRSHQFDGRRLVRVNGGYLVLNFINYRDRDHTSATRSKRYRERKKASSDSHAVSHERHAVTDTQAVSSKQSAEAEAGTTKEPVAPSATPDPSTAVVHQNGNGNGKAGQSVDAIIGYLQEVGKESFARLSRNAMYEVYCRIIFAYWAKRMGFEKVLYDKKRMRFLLARLNENGGVLSEMLYVVDGAMRDGWAMGKDPKSPRPYNGIEHLFRDRGTVEKFALAVEDWQAGKMHPMATRYAAAPAA